MNFDTAIPLGRDCAGLASSTGDRILRPDQATLVGPLVGRYTRHRQPPGSWSPREVGEANAGFLKLRTAKVTSKAYLP